MVRRAKQDADAAREALGHAQYLRANAIGAEQRLAHLRAGAQRATRQRQAVQLGQERAAERALLAQLFYERSGTPPPDPGPPPPRDATEPDAEVVAAAQALRELEQSVAPLPTSPTVTGMAGWVTPVRLGGAILAGLAGIGLIIAIVAGSIPRRYRSGSDARCGQVADGDGGRACPPDRRPPQAPRGAGHDG